MENWLRKRARLSPGRLALRCDGRSLTFAQLRDEVSRRADVLSGPAMGDGRLGLLGDNSMDLACWLLAGLTAGRQVVLLNTRLAPPEVQAQIAKAGVSLLVGETDTSHIDAPVVSWTAAERLPAGSCGWPEWPADAVATIMFTSGSSGAPKGVLQTFGNHAAAATGSVLNLGLEPCRDAWLAPTPLFHISGLSVLLRCLLYGIPCLLQRRFDAAAVARAVRSGEATVASVVPQMLGSVLDHLDGPPAPGFRAFLLGGGFSEPDVIDRCVARGIPVVPSYGMSETCAHVVACPPDAPPAKLTTAGQALIGTDLRISAPDADGCGEIQVRSPAVVAGYLDDADSYARAWTEDGWFHTGDLGQVDADGYLTVRARLSSLIVSGGENIVPAEVEAVLAGQPDVADCAVVGAPDRRWGFVPVAFVVPRSQGLDEAALRAACRGRLAGYKCPRHYVVVTALPRTAVGKVHVAELERRARELASGEKPAAGPPGQEPRHD